MQFLHNLAARSADDFNESSEGDMCIDEEGDDVCCQVPEYVLISLCLAPHPWLLFIVLLRE